MRRHVISELQRNGLKRNDENIFNLEPRVPLVYYSASVMISKYYQDLEEEQKNREKIELRRRENEMNVQRIHNTTKSCILAKIFIDKNSGEEGQKEQHLDNMALYNINNSGTVSDNSLLKKSFVLMENTVDIQHSICDFCKISECKCNRGGNINIEDKLAVSAVDFRPVVDFQSGVDVKSYADINSPVDIKSDDDDDVELTIDINPVDDLQLNEHIKSVDNIDLKSVVEIDDINLSDDLNSSDIKAGVNLQKSVDINPNNLQVHFRDLSVTDHTQSISDYQGKGDFKRPLYVESTVEIQAYDCQSDEFKHPLDVQSTVEVEADFQAHDDFKHSLDIQSSVEIQSVNFQSGGYFNIQSPVDDSNVIEYKSGDFKQGQKKENLFSNNTEQVKYYHNNIPFDSEIHRTNSKNDNLNEIKQIANLKNEPKNLTSNKSKRDHQVYEKFCGTKCGNSTDDCIIENSEVDNSSEEEEFDHKAWVDKENLMKGSIEEEFVRHVLKDKYKELERDEAVLNLSIPNDTPKRDIPEDRSEFSNSPKFLPDTDKLVQHCLSEEEKPVQPLLPSHVPFLSDNSNFYDSSHFRIVPEYKMELKENGVKVEKGKMVEESENTNENPLDSSTDSEIDVLTVGSDTDLNMLLQSLDEKRKPLKKRISAIVNVKVEEEDLKDSKLLESKNKEISYPATPMISIAEVEALKSEYKTIPNVEQLHKISGGRIFKTPAERKEMPPLPNESSMYYNVNPEPSPIITDQFNINNHTYNNPIINYHVNGVPVMKVRYPTYCPMINTPMMFQFPSAEQVNLNQESVNQQVNLNQQNLTQVNLNQQNHSNLTEHVNLANLTQINLNPQPNINQVNLGQQQRIQQPHDFQQSTHQRIFQLNQQQSLLKQQQNLTELQQKVLAQKQDRQKQQINLLNQQNLINKQQTYLNQKNQILLNQQLNDQKQHSLQQSLLEQHLNQTESNLTQNNVVNLQHQDLFSQKQVLFGQQSLEQIKLNQQVLLNKQHLHYNEEKLNQHKQNQEELQNFKQNQQLKTNSKQNQTIQEKIQNQQVQMKQKQNEELKQNQCVKNQNLHNHDVENQFAESQRVKNQHIENRQIENVRNQHLRNQQVENKNLKSQIVQNHNKKNQQTKHNQQQTQTQPKQNQQQHNQTQQSTYNQSNQQYQNRQQNQQQQQVQENKKGHNKEQKKENQDLGKHNQQKENQVRQQAQRRTQQVLMTKRSEKYRRS